MLSRLNAVTRKPLAVFQTGAFDPEWPRKHQVIAPSGRFCRASRPIHTRPSRIIEFELSAERSDRGRKSPPIIIFFPFDTTHAAISSSALL